MCDVLCMGNWVNVWFSFMAGKCFYNRLTEEGVTGSFVETELEDDWRSISLDEALNAVKQLY